MAPQRLSKSVASTLQWSVARGKAWASIILGALCTLPGPANCEERIVAAWLTDGSNGKTTPAMAVTLINNGSIAGETLRAAIGYPVDSTTKCTA